MLADNARIVWISMEIGFIITSYVIQDERWKMKQIKYRRSYGILCLSIEARKFDMPNKRKHTKLWQTKNIKISTAGGVGIMLANLNARNFETSKNSQCFWER